MIGVRFLAVLLLVGGVTPVDGALPPAWRKPSAAVLLEGGTRLAVANEGTGSLSLVALKSAGDDAGAGDSRVVEQAVGRSLTDLAAIPSTGWLLATDAGTHELRGLKVDGDAVVTLGTAPVAKHPVSVCVSHDGRLASVASLWSRCVTLVELDLTPAGPELRPVAVLPLEFNPRLQLVLDDRRVLVVDAFGGRLALIDLAERTVKPLRSLHGGNVRGVALSRDKEHVVFAHSIQNPLAHTDFNDIHWGMLTNNVLREIPLAGLIDPSSAERETPVRQVGQPGFGAADLAGLAQLRNGNWAVLSSGTGDLSILTTPAGISARISVGARPLSLVLDDRGTVFVVNQLSDSISVVDPAGGAVVETISLGPMPEPTPASRGERLFFSAKLSHDQWLSCHSCHVDGHTTNGLADTHSDGTFGTPKKILSLLGTRDANPWGWNGAFRELHEQVESSITSSMQGPQPTLEEVSDLTAYLHTLRAAPPVLDPVGEEQVESVAAGRQVFEREGCAKCHVPSLTFTTDAVFDVGLTDEEGLSKFNPPSLRGVSQRSTFLHDGRAKSLRSVFEDHSHQIPGGLGPQDLNRLLEYLRSI
ncbi:Di-heme cytochrome c peroxidase [Caulifigura coniformis]|uniref:Di-heme cytochrome c peroxidase n=1 Tax=Caulifigura coniformis TaxID=2527983 RepID=A0A517SCE8_9PLAN|nr:cytochrome c peroxidase [Caulifigura coniformis]QDT53809.1 Di-heme cytochrome c peroxidase [Caulifigura coniformis]